MAEGARQISYGMDSGFFSSALLLLLLSFIFNMEISTPIVHKMKY